MKTKLKHLSFTSDDVIEFGRTENGFFNSYIYMNHCDVFRDFNHIKFGAPFTFMLSAKYSKR